MCTYIDQNSNFEVIKKIMPAPYFQDIYLYAYNKNVIKHISSFQLDVL